MDKKPKKTKKAGKFNLNSDDVFHKEFREQLARDFPHKYHLSRTPSNKATSRSAYINDRRNINVRRNAYTTPIGGSKRRRQSYKKKSKNLRRTRRRRR